MANVYNFDPTGTSAANRITNEQHVLTAVNFRNYHYIIPNFAPMFRRNATVKIQFPDKSERNLVEGVDFYFSNQFIDASKACATPIFASISFLDTSMYGIVSISYNTVGGIWNLTPAEITRILAEESRNPRTTSYEQITYLPERFPVVDHEWDLVDMVGQKELVSSIDAVTAAILASNGGGLTAHLQDLNNPHATTKAQVGLGAVQNYGIATQLQAEAGTASNVYMTPLRTANAIAKLGKALVDAHEQRTDNPHGVNKSQVGLPLVQNYAMATLAEATQGTLSDRYMSPAATKAVVDIVNAALAAHVANHQNPHDVDKQQVALFNVENYTIATEQEARAGLANDRYMTPLRTMQLVREFVTVQLDGHAARTDNPHNTTKDQVGLANVQNYGIATTSEMTAGTATNKYVTPSLVAFKVQQLYTNSIEPHLLDFDNPHNVTPSQIGAYTTLEVDNLLATYLKKTATAADSSKLENRTTLELRDWLMNNMPGFNADKLGGMTVQDLVTMISGQVGSTFLKSAIETVSLTSSQEKTWVAIGELTYVRDGNGRITDLDYAAILTTGDTYTNAAAIPIDPLAIRTVLHQGANAAPKLEVHRIFPASATPNVEVGWTVNETDKIMRIFAKVDRTTTRINVADAFGRIFDTEIAQIEYATEPTGIVYATITSNVTTAAGDALAKRVTDIETLLAGITVV